MEFTVETATVSGRTARLGLVCTGMPTSAVLLGKDCGSDCPAETPVGLRGLESDWIGWVKRFPVLRRMPGLIARGVMMVGRRKRSRLAAEGAHSPMRRIASLSAVSLASGVVSLIVT
ncbi:hypothetical protein [Streptomyces sp. RFCAC02]|uniref:hypothetical protein n=1 Tax=Streptomyces sp. RFCAC02 TaxID=2499143 RepID=UPI001020D15A|nr:hypothetical protein [Streptomyces sp. RFCAC02]